jgi:dihydroorotate dehydrogenase (NAD+) catalytic subunit
VKFLGKEITGEFTIPSGIVTTSSSALALVAKKIPEVGVLTTKSIGVAPRQGNREPIITEYSSGCFMNAVGLSNPGAEEFAGQLESMELPKGRFLLTSIFGGSAEDFVRVAELVAPHSDALELNYSCPHAKGYGMAIGQDPKVVREITEAVASAVKVPLVAKLTPNTNIIGEIALAAVDGGAKGICAINTVGPGYYSIDGEPVLSNKKGGLSGRGILPIGLKCVRDVREAVEVPIIGCGGIRCADDVRAYRDAGANIFGVGSALACLSTDRIAAYFTALSRDLNESTNDAEPLLVADARMRFKKYLLKKNECCSIDLSVLEFNASFDAEPGQFVFARVPGVGEKPFSILSCNPLRLAVQERGEFTKHLLSLSNGAEVYFRGPHGSPIKLPKNRKIMLVAGGCGLAALLEVAKRNSCCELFVGARDAKHLFSIEEAKSCCERVFICTDDGSGGRKGFVTDALRERLQELGKRDYVFLNCGPEPMINAAVAVERDYAPREFILSSRERVAKCGVGLCGSCALADGRRLCVDGPFLEELK